jgi:hypothetical protein
VRARIEALLNNWRRKPPTREGYLESAGALAAGRQSGLKPLWPRSPRMLTATLDDGWGHGLDIIHALAEAVGVRVEPLGVLQPPETVVAACRQQRPDLLGLTVLQFDADDAVRHILEQLPPNTTLIAGGAAYQFDPDFAGRTQTPYVARNGAAFLQFLLNYRLPGQT